MNKKTIKVLVPAGALGIPFDKNALINGIKQKPDLIAIDGGSTDSGPYYLGSGKSKYSYSATKRDWSILMEMRAKAKVPLLIGTAGTCGTKTSVEWMLKITKEIAKENKEKLKIVTLKTDLSNKFVLEKYKTGKIKPLEGAPKINEDIINNCTNIVALAGVEQIQKAINTNADIIISGRSTDTAIIASLPIYHGLNIASAWHGAKIAECGALATNNPNSGVVLLEFDHNGFTITPMCKNTKATPQTVFAHMLYENADPYILLEPGGYLDVSNAKYKKHKKNSVRVEGSKWYNKKPYTLKIEGARLVGFQTISIVLIRDPKYIESIDKWIDKLRNSFYRKIKNSILVDVQLELRKIGKDATLGNLEPISIDINEIAVMAIFTATNQEKANDSAKLLNPDLLHLALTKNEPMPTFAFPFSPPEIDKGPLFEFCFHHVIEIDNPKDFFQLQFHKI